MSLLNSISDAKPTPRKIVWEILLFAASELPFVIMEAMIAKRTGSLTVNFSNGTPAGNIEWKQKSLVPVDTQANPNVEST